MAGLEPHALLVVLHGFREQAHVHQGNAQSS